MFIDEKKIIWGGSILILFLTLLIAVNGIYKPQIAKKAVLEVQLKEENERNLLKGSILSLRGNIAEWTKKFYNKNEVSLLLRFISDAADSGNIELNLVKPRAIKEYGSYGLIPIELKFKGTYKEIGFFVSLLENADRFIKISNLEIAGPFENKSYSPDAKSSVRMVVSAMYVK